MDLDIEMDDAGHEAPIAELPRDDILQPDEPEEPGEVADDGVASDESRTIVPNKVHIRGVDTLHTEDIKAYVKSHFGAVDRVEWIDDSSANLLFSSEPTARDAIAALSAIEVADASALAIGEALPAKPFDARPEISLQVRFAVQNDRKQSGAALRSRYYLLHPEHDPEERRRRQQETRSRYRDRDGGYRGNGSGGGRRRRDSDDEVETFEASMYDDAPRPPRLSDSEDRTKTYASENRGKELFLTRRSGRNRSASPMRESESDDLMGDRASSALNRTKAQSIRGRLSAGNSAKELFPSKGPITRGGGQLDQLERAIGSARLKEEDRPKVVEVADSGSGAAFNIRGMASKRAEGEGFTIKGAASGASARELFPDRFGGGNAGKELFDGGRSKRRQKAEDLFS